jgi:hypothetical protein
MRPPNAEDASVSLPPVDLRHFQRDPLAPGIELSGRDQQSAARRGTSQVG